MSWLLHYNTICIYFWITIKGLKFGYHLKYLLLILLVVSLSNCNLYLSLGFLISWSLVSSQTLSFSKILSTTKNVSCYGRWVYVLEIGEIVSRWKIGHCLIAIVKGNMVQQGVFANYAQNFWISQLLWLFVAFFLVYYVHHKYSSLSR